MYVPTYRQKFLVSKVIENQPDEVDEEYVQSGKKTNIMIANTDFDWEDPEGEEYSFLGMFFLGNVLSLESS